MAKVSWFTVGVALSASVGTFLYVSARRQKRLAEVVVTSSKLTIGGISFQGFDTGIATTSEFAQSCLQLPHLLKETGPLFLLSSGKRLTDRVAIAHESWVAYMDRPSAGLTGAVGPPRHGKPLSQVKGYEC